MSTATPDAAPKYRVATFRAAGLEAKWGKTRNGAPIIFARDPKSPLEHLRATWWVCGRPMWDKVTVLGLPVEEAFEQANLLGDVFSVPA